VGGLVRLTIAQLRLQPRLQGRRATSAAEPLRHSRKCAPRCQQVQLQAAGIAVRGAGCQLNRHLPVVLEPLPDLGGCWGRHKTAQTRHVTG
jgi:hypothetical protein